MSQATSYRIQAAECLKLAGSAFTADDRRNLSKMAADWYALADMVEEREDVAKPEARPAREPVAGEPKKRKKPRVAPRPTEPKVIVRRARSAPAKKSRA
jgi:hypothetical protein